MIEMNKYVWGREGEGERREEVRGGERREGKGPAPNILAWNHPYP